MLIKKEKHIVAVVVVVFLLLAFRKKKKKQLCLWKSLKSLCKLMTITFNNVAIIG